MWQALVLAGLWLVQPSPARAEAEETLRLDGIAFAAEHGNLRLLDGWGRGTFDDPYVVVEEIHGDGASILTIRNVERRFGEPSRFGHGIGFVLQKIVTNRTSRTWNDFEMELREWLEIPSGYFDGLSFGQAKDRRDDIFFTDVFDSVEILDEPSDRVVYFAGDVEPGETVTMQLVVTDFSPKSTFYLFQRSDAPLAALDRH